MKRSFQEHGLDLEMELAHETCRQPGSEADATPVFRHCDGQLEVKVLSFTAEFALISRD